MSKMPTRDRKALSSASALSAADAGFKRVMFIAPTGRSFTRARDALMRDIVARRHRVLCLAPDMTAADIAALQSFGAEARGFSAKPPLISALAERAKIGSLAEAIAEWQPHVAVSSGGRMAALGVLAAHKARVTSNVMLVNGLAGLKDAGAQRLVRKALLAATSAVFHNGDDVRTLRLSGVLPEELPVTVVSGAGVDLAHHAVQPLPPLDHGLVFAMIARLDPAHGARTFCEAARLVRARSASARFLLAGPPAAAGEAALEDLRAYDEVVTCLGNLDDVRPVLARAHVFVYPSQGEGLPRTVLEAMAAGRPILTTNTAGCRDTVDERVNGCLVPADDASALAQAMESFLKRPDLVPAMARASRLKAERRFDVREVSRATMAALGLG